MGSRGTPNPAAFFMGIGWKKSMEEKQVENPVKADKPKRKMPKSPGRRRMLEGGFVRVCVSMSAKDREKLRILGGSEWIRQVIRKAKI